MATGRIYTLYFLASSVRVWPGPDAAEDWFDKRGVYSKDYRYCVSGAGLMSGAPD